MPRAFASLERAIELNEEPQLKPYIDIPMMGKMARANTLLPEPDSPTSATVLPGGSELALYTLLRADPGLLWPAWMMSTVGNTLRLAVSGCKRLMSSVTAVPLRGRLWA